MMYIELFEGKNRLLIAKDGRPDVNYQIIKKWHYIFRSNGHVLCTSRPYTSKGIAKRAVQDFIHKLEKQKFNIEIREK